MRMFIWSVPESNEEGDLRLTDNYHDGGGLIVVASSLARAKEIIKEKGKTEYQLNPEFEAPKPDYEYVLEDNVKENLILFPNAGCC